MYCPPSPPAKTRAVALRRTIHTIVPRSADLGDEYGALPAAAAVVGAKVVGGVKRIFKKPAHKRAADEVKRLVPAALAGDAAALARLEQGAAGAATAKAKAVFRAALDRVLAQLGTRPAATPPPITTPQVSPPVTTITPAGPVVTPAMTTAAPLPLPSAPAAEPVAVPQIPGVAPTTEGEAPPIREAGKAAGLGGNVGLLLAAGLAVVALAPKGRGGRRR